MDEIHHSKLDPLGERKLRTVVEWSPSGGAYRSSMRHCTLSRPPPVSFSPPNASTDFGRRWSQGLHWQYRNRWPIAEQKLFGFTQVVGKKSNELKPAARHLCRGNCFL